MLRANINRFKPQLKEIRKSQRFFYLIDQKIQKNWSFRSSNTSQSTKNTVSDVAQLLRNQGNVFYSPSASFKLLLPFPQKFVVPFWTAGNFLSWGFSWCILVAVVTWKHLKISGVFYFLLFMAFLTSHKQICYNPYKLIFHFPLFNLQKFN